MTHKKKSKMKTTIYLVFIFTILQMQFRMYELDGCKSTNMRKVFADQSSNDETTLYIKEGRGEFVNNHNTTVVTLITITHTSQLRPRRKFRREDDLRTVKICKI